MGGLFGGDSSNNAETVPTYTQLNIQTSTQGIPIPIVFGRQRVAGNLIYYNNFHSVTTSSGGKGGGGGKGGQSTTTYYADIAMAVCEGDNSGITDIPGYWRDGNPVNLPGSNWFLFKGTATQAPWSGFAAGQQLAYARTCYMVSPDHDLGSSATLSSLTWDVKGFFWGEMSAFGIADDMILGHAYEQLLVNQNYGIGFSSAWIDAASLAYWNTYTQAAGLFFSPYLKDQEQLTSITDRWAQLTNSWIFWTGETLKFVPLGDTAISAFGANYVPNITPIYDLTNDQFQRKSASDPPVTVTRRDILECYNQVQLDILERSNKYNNYSIKWQDQTSIDLNGALQSQTIQANEICTLGVGNLVATLIGKRAVNIRNEYDFYLSSDFILLEPGDIVTLTEPFIGLNRIPVRIKEVEEDEENTIHIIAEEFPAGVGVAAAYSISAPTPNPTYDAFVDPGSVNPPGIFEPNSNLTGGNPAIFIALSGGQYWGGALIYISFDAGVTYSPFGQIEFKSIQGVSTNTLPIHADPDTADTLTIDTSESALVMPLTATNADADAFRTLALIGNELISYGHVTVGGGPDIANLTYLRRGVYGTTIASHPAGSQFSRIDLPDIYQFQLPSDYVGQTLYFKFPSFNTFGNSVQDISVCTAYSYTPNGLGYFIAAPLSPNLAVVRNTQTDGTTFLIMHFTWVASTGPKLGSYNVEYSEDGGVTWTGNQTVGSGAVSWDLNPAKTTTNYQFRVQAVSTNGQAISAWATSAVVNSGTLTSGVPSAPTGVSANPDGTFALVTWSTSPDLTIRTYQIWRAPGLGAAFGSATQIATEVVGSTSYLDQTTAAGSPYTYFVIATNASGSSPASTGANVTTGTVSNPWIIQGSLAPQSGAYDSGFELFNISTLSGMALLTANLSQWLLECEVAPGANATLNLTKNGVNIGHGTILAGATTGTWTFASNVSFAAGDSFKFLAPSPADSSLSGLSYTIVGIRP